MKRRRLSPETRLERTRKKFENWRETKNGHPRIPEALWTRAIELSADYSVNKIARALRLNNMDLKKRVDSTSGGQKPAKIAKPSFVELDSSLAPLGPECVLEFEQPGGARMKISIKGQAADALAALSEAFWRQGE